MYLYIIALSESLDQDYIDRHSYIEVKNASLIVCNHTHYFCTALYLVKTLHHDGMRCMTQDFVIFIVFYFRFCMVGLFIHTVYYKNILLICIISLYIHIGLPYLNIT